MKLREGSLTGLATVLLCVRDLAALSVHPLLVHPTHYTGEEGYISDTEDTQVIHTGGAGQLSVAGNIVTDIYLLTILVFRHCRGCFNRGIAGERGAVNRFIQNCVVCTSRVRL